MYFIQTVFDEGITLRGNLLIETNELLHEVYQAVFLALHREAQIDPKLFDLRIDSPEAKAARNISPPTTESEERSDR